MWQKIFDDLVGHVVRRGDLVIDMPDGTTRRYGDGTGEEIRVRITDPAFLAHAVRDPDMAMGEGYMDGRMVIEDDRVDAFLHLIISNVSTAGRVWWNRWYERGRAGLRWMAQFNPTGRARANVAHHYDLSGELYDLFLDADKQYSCAYFPRPDMTLEEAQEAKKAHIAAKLLIEPGMRVLDIGCGWGGMALTLARDHGAHVVGVTLSEEQHKVATARAAEAGLSDRIDIRLTDYRLVDERFDRIVSVGMFEHVGVPHYREYFSHVRSKLNDDGVALIHTIGRTSPPGVTSSWIAKYIFPGGYIPSLSEMAAAVEKADLYPTDVEIWRLHYAETLRLWRMRFESNIDRIRTLYDDRFCRMWRYYLVVSEMTFRLNRQCVFQYQMARRQDAVPLTRDYMHRPAEAEDLRHAAE